MTAPLDPFQRRARLYPGTGPHDADSLILEIDQGWYGRAEPPLRVSRAFMPELHQAGGPEMLAYAVGWIDEWRYGEQASHLSWPFWVVSTKTVRLPEAKQITTLGRFVTDIYRWDGRHVVGPSLTAVLNDELAQHPGWGHGAGA